MKVELIDIILIVLFFQLLSLTPYLIFHKNKHSHSNKILALFLVSKALCISNIISFRLFNITFEYFPHIYLVGSSFTLLWGPTLYFYTKTLTNIKFRFRILDLIHLFPFICHLAYLTIIFHIYNAASKRILIYSDTLLPDNYYLIYFSFLHFTILLYTFASFKTIFTYRKEIKEAYSSLKSINLSWLIFVLSGFMLKWILDVWLFIGTSFFQSTSTFPFLSSRIILFLFINIMIFKVLRQPAIFSGITIELQKNISLSDKIMNQYFNKLNLFMSERKPYLIPELTLNDLSEKVSIPPRSLSEVINNRIGQNFYDFINLYRINESKQLLSNPSMSNKTILEVLYEVGYNSKSSFYKAFKKQTGLSPLQYKENCIQNN